MGTANRPHSPSNHDTHARAGLPQTKHASNLTPMARSLLPNLTHDVIHRQSVAAAAARNKRPARWGKAYRPDPSEFEE